MHGDIGSYKGGTENVVIDNIPVCPSLWVEHSGHLDAPLEPSQDDVLASGLLGLLPQIHHIEEDAGLEVVGQPRQVGVPEGLHVNPSPGHVDCYLTGPGLAPFGDGKEAELGRILRRLEEVGVETPAGQQVVIGFTGKLRNASVIITQVVIKKAGDSFRP
jgi:hypothetical protein